MTIYISQVERLHVPQCSRAHRHVPRCSSALKKFKTNPPKFATIYMFKSYESQSVALLRLSDTCIKSFTASGDTVGCYPIMT